MGDKGSLILMIVVVVLLIVMFAVSYVRKRKYNNELSTMREELKIGDRVMIDTGVVGELVDTYEEEGYKYYVLKSGKGNNVGYFAVHANAVYYVFGKDKEKHAPKTDAKVETKKEDTVETTSNPETETQESLVEENTEPKLKKSSKK